MCGRFAFFLPPAELFRLFGCTNLINFPARYNAAPMQNHPVIIRNRMGLARWGFLPPWCDADDKATAAKMINARSETVMEKPAFAAGWRRGHRCLVPANGFFEWYGPEGKTTPYFIHRQDNKILAMAGLWAKRAGLVTFTVLTKEATEPLRRFHHHMPVIFDPAQAQRWFSSTAEEAAGMIQQAAVNDLAFHVVGKDVGKVTRDSPELIAPLQAGGLL